MVKKIQIAKGKKVTPKRLKELKKKPGSSNVGKYKGVSKGDFCGPAAGAAPGTYPINTKKRAKAALAYAHNAPNPEAIKKCVKRKYPTLGKPKKAAKSKK